MADTNSTRQLVSVTDIRESVLFIGGGSLRLVMEISAINFELRSEEEQLAILQGFQQFINSVDFPIQIIINSRKYDIANYLKLVEEATVSLTNELLKLQASEYMKYVAELSELANIMSKKFYIVIPFFAFEAPGKAGVMDSLRNLFKPAKTSSQITEEQFQTYKNQLLQRSELVLSGLVGLGLRTRILEQEELLRLFQSLYNPQTTLQPQS